QVPLVKPASLLPFHAVGNTGQITGQDECEERAKILHTVLDGGTGKDEAGAGLQCPKRSGRLRAPVLDVLCLIGDDQCELLRVEKLLVPYEGAVGCHYEIVCGKLPRI